MAPAGPEALARPLDRVRHANQCRLLVRAVPLARARPVALAAHPGRAHREARSHLAARAALPRRSARSGQRDPLRPRVGQLAAPPDPRPAFPACRRVPATPPREFLTCVPWQIEFL